MSCTKIIRVGLAWVLLALSLTACARAAPTTAPTATVEATATIRPSATTRPTRTPVPTKTTTLAVTPTTAANTAAGGAAAGTGTDATGGNAGTAGTGTGAGAGAAAPGAGPEDKYQFLGQSIPDKTQVRPGQTITITWTIKNSGTAAWSTDYSMRYFSGPQPTKTIYNFTKIVPVDKTIDLTVTFTAPMDYGDYDFWWKLTNAQGKNFGDVDFVFTVTANPTKATATPTK